jgi:hypothetical protein
VPAAESRRWLRSPLVLRGLAIAAVLALLVLLTLATSSTPLGMRVAGLFGGLVNAIRRNPGGTAVVAFLSIAALWLGIGLAAFSQQWLAAKKR